MTDSQVTKPPLPLLVTSVLMLCGVGSMVAGAIAVLIAPRLATFGALGGAICMLPWFLAFGVAVYLSIFRQNRTATKMAATGYFVGAAFMLFGLVTNIGEAIGNGEDDYGFLVRFSVVFLAICGYLTLSGILSLRWLRRLPSSSPTPRQPAFPAQPVQDCPGHD